MLRWLRLRSGERGQAALTLVPALFLFAVFGAASIDVGLLVNAKRASQSAVDRAALAGASALSLDASASATDTAAAIARATTWAQKNGIDTTAPGFGVSVVQNCYSADDGVPDGVTVTVDHPVRSYFVQLLGVLNWHASATATACAGRPTGMTGFLPWALSLSSNCFHTDANGNRVPTYGERCDIVVNSTSTGLSGELGVAINQQCDSGNSSSSVLRQNLASGVSAFCTVGDSIQGNTGFSTGANRQGLRDRLSTDGACDANYPGTAADFATANNALDATVSIPLYDPMRGDGMDDFYETYRYDPTAPGPAEGLEPYDCDPTTAGLQTSPRNVTVVLVQNYATPDGNAGPMSYLVRGFAGMYLEGCTGSDGVFKKDCNIPGGPFTVHARFVSRIDVTDANLGPVGVGDIGIFLAR